MTAEIRDPRLAALRGDSLHHMAAVEQAVLEVRRLHAQAPTAAELVLRDLATELASLLHRTARPRATTTTKSRTRTSAASGAAIAFSPGAHVDPDADGDHHGPSFQTALKNATDYYGAMGKSMRADAAGDSTRRPATKAAQR